MTNFLQAARHTDPANPLPHQDAAWQWAWELLTADEQREFLEMFRADPPSKTGPSANTSRWLPLAMEIIKEFEGCRLEAYHDPVGIPTIGYGATRYRNGKGAVRMGDRITALEAESLLRADLIALFGPGVLHLFPCAADWEGHRIAALVSWAYNCGLSAVEESTLRRRVLRGEEPCRVVREELPRWCKAGDKELEGLKRRRAAEVQLFCGGKKPAAVEQERIPGRVTEASPLEAHLTPHFTLGEFALGSTARRFTARHQVDTAAELAAFLERVRAAFGSKAVVITSGYRPSDVNRAVGGASNSEHLYSQPGEGAVDFYVRDADINAVQDYCDRNWPFSVGYGAPKGFVHIGRRASGERRRWDY